MANTDGTATIIHPISSVGTLQFASAACPNGWPLDQASADEEILKSAGVDGFRTRVQELQQAQFTWVGWQDATSYQAAIALGRLHRAAKVGYPVILTVTMAGVNYRFVNVHIDAVNPVVSRGGLFGLPALSGSDSKVMTTFQMTLQDPSTQGTSV